MTGNSTLAAALLLLTAGCTPNYPADPTPDELQEMHEAMRNCLDEVVPLETSFSRRCQALEDALIAYYGSLDAYRKAVDAHP